MRNKLAIMIACCVIGAQAAELKLPELMAADSGEKISSPEAWNQKRRAELLEAFRQHVYGRNAVDRPEQLSFTLKETDKNAMDGKATRKHVVIAYKGPGGEGAVNLHIFIPNERKKPAPAFLLICNRPTSNIDPTRATKSPFWPAEEMIARGYAAVAFHNAEIDPDKHDGFKNGVHGIFDKKEAPRAPDAWGTIGAWAWGASRVMDYFETDPDIDAKRVGVVGHSRGGKTALWCGAQDERFAMVVSNCSGCSGAALARRKQGETIEKINKNFPHWFNENYKKYNGRDEELPVDQHMLIALVAPRLAYVASATKDAWADPEGEYLAAFHASPAWQLFGKPGLLAEKMPAPDAPAHEGRVGYHIRTGKHDLTEYDWKCYMDFADKHGMGAAK